MTAGIRPRRSVLYMPGINQRAMEKAKQLTADAVIFDLEDAVSPGAKTEARQLVCTQVSQGGYGRREVLIRINGAGTDWGEDDLVAAVHAQPHAILVPKVESAEMAEYFVQRIRELGGGPALWVMIETARGVSNVEDIAAVAGVTVLVMGTSDLAKELRAVSTPDRQALLYSLSRTVLAARRHGLDVLDGVSQVLDDEVAFSAVCQQGRELGFDGKTLIHPAQIEPANRIFGPTAQEVDYAERVIQAWRQAEAEGRGIAVLDGKMIENLHAEEARRIVAFEHALRQQDQ